MSLLLPLIVAPSAPSSGYGDLYFDTDDGRVKMKLADGSYQTLTDTGRAGNLLLNGGFRFAQRQAPATLTTYSNTSGRTYGPDRWALTNENASVQFARVDTASSPETGLSARYYGQVKKITSAGKWILSQAIEGGDVMAYRGRRVRIQFKAKNNVGTNTLRLALLQLTTAGTLDTIPATFVAAFGAASTDPTWGTALSAVAPAIAGTNTSISGNGLNCILNTSWRRYSGVWTVPSDCKNLVVAVFTNGQPSANDVVDISEIGIYDGDEERDWLPESVGEELARCQRFCWKTFADPALPSADTAPAQAAGVQIGEFRYPALSAGATVHRPLNLNFAVLMRAAPTVTLYSPSSASAQFRDTTGNLDCTSSSATAITARGCNFLTTGHASTSIGNILAIHILAEAEL